MNIIELVPYILPYKGGQEKYVYNLSKYLVAKGHDVQIYASNYPITVESEIVDDIKITRNKCFLRILRNPIYFGYSKIFSDIGKNDIIHIHNEHSFSSLIASIFKYKLQNPLIITCHGRLVFGTLIKDIIEGIYFKTFGKFVFSQSDAIVVNSQCDKEYILSLNPDLQNKIYQVHNAVDGEYFNEISKKCTPKKNQDKFVILFVGRLIKRKGIEWLIKSIAIIKDQFDANIECIFVGDGEDKEYFTDLAKNTNVLDSISFKGEVDELELVTLYLSSDIFVLPSLSEVCPTVVLEAMYFSLPVVATNIPGIYDHFEDVALLVPPKDEISLSEAIMSLYDDRDLYNKLSEKGNKLVCTKYTWHQVSEDYEKIFMGFSRGLN